LLSFWALGAAKSTLERILDARNDFIRFRDTFRARLGRGQRSFGFAGMGIA